MFKPAAAVGVVLLFAGAAAAGEMEAPRVVLSEVNWAEAAASLSDHGIDPPATEFARINALTEKRFPGIANSSVPVLLPIDIDAYRKDVADGVAGAATADKYFGPFHPSKLFLPGPAGYTATFFADRGTFNFTFSKPVEVEITGGAFVYDLDGPAHQEVFPPPKELADRFPGMQRILREAHVRYAFSRFGVPYVVAIQCYDQPRSSRYLSCKEADPVAVKFLLMLNTAGGTPMDIAQPHIDLTRPAAKSDFTYYPPGDLIPSTGWRKMPGRADYHVYARIRSPIADAPSYVKSQSFMPWGDCYHTRHSGRLGRKGSVYSCNVNGIPLVFDESAAVNWTYPWRDNFCELRDFLVGQCPGGYGHQGEDIRPGNCVLNNEGADRCEPYQHDVAAVRDGMIWRSPGNIGLYIDVNTKDDFVRFRYLHMNPKIMDAEGWLSGRKVKEGEIIGKVATWGDYEKGTSYHIHFNIQVFTKVGWVWVNPYMTLVLAYERQIGGRGTELAPGAPPPPVPVKPPIIAHPTPVPVPPLPPTTSAAAAEPAQNSDALAPAKPEAKGSAVIREEPHKIRAQKKPRKRHHARRRRRSRHADDDG
jgi:murein DD-endopeptidase MepM/ murein hydrolase activator NlpD